VRTQDLVVELLHGAIDTHVHSAPDVVPRLLDDIETARQARDAGFRAIVLKNHHSLTAARAAIAEKVVGGIQVFGGLVRNEHACGGLNPFAVEAALRMGARIIWLPTFTSARAVQQAREHQATGHTAQGTLPAIGISMLDDRGQLRAELREILEIVAQHNAVLATGHVAPAESSVVVPAALNAGVASVVITHPENVAVGMSVPDQRALAELPNVYFERIFREPVVVAGQIKAIGVATTILATDYGQPWNPSPVEGMRRFLATLLEMGLPASDLRQMAQTNPARVLGID
jgi:hypothetical protein